VDNQGRIPDEARLSGIAEIGPLAITHTGLNLSDAATDIYLGVATILRMTNHQLLCIVYTNLDLMDIAANRDIGYTPLPFRLSKNQLLLITHTTLILIDYSGRDRALTAILGRPYLRLLFVIRTDLDLNDAIERDITLASIGCGGQIYGLFIACAALILIKTSNRELGLGTPLLCHHGTGKESDCGNSEKLLGGFHVINSS
jgi:hypothetical protein